MRWVVLVLMLVACSEKKRDQPPPPPPPPPKPAGPPPSCVEFEKLLDHLEQCADKEQSSYVDIQMAKSSLRMERDPAKLAVFCTESIPVYRAAFPRCTTAEARGSAPPPLEPVPLEPSVLGKSPGPFGRLAFLRAGITRDQILDELGIRDERGPSINVDLGIIGLEDARIDIDFAGTFDIVKVSWPPSNLREMLVTAWGEPTRGSTWFDTAKRWRVDLLGGLMIGPYVPFATLIGDGPDGLPEATTLLGLTHAQVRARYGAQFNGREILMPATDVCAYYTKLYVDFDERTNLVAKLRLEQCFDSNASTKAVLDAMTHAWGTATLIKRDGKDLVTFARPGRSIELRREVRSIVATITTTAER